MPSDLYPKSMTTPRSLIPTTVPRTTSPSWRLACSCSNWSRSCPKSTSPAGRGSSSSAAESAVEDDGVAAAAELADAEVAGAEVAAWGDEVSASPDGWLIFSSLLSSFGSSLNMQTPTSHTISACQRSFHALPGTPIVAHVHDLRTTWRVLLAWSPGDVSD